MARRLSEAQKHHRHSARFWGKQVIDTIKNLPYYDQSLAWYQARPDYADSAANTAETLAIEESRLYKNAVRAAHQAGLAIDNLWTR